MRRERFWGADKDAHAAEALGVSTGYTIFMASAAVDVLMEEPEDIYDLEEPSYLSRDMFLPKHVMYVGMGPIDATTPDEMQDKAVYGFVNFADMKETEE